MHRFGRSAPQKMKDRWGGGFIVATILALLAAWFAGDNIGKIISGRNTAGLPGNTAGSGEKMTVSADPKEFQLHFVRVGLFRSKANYMKAVADMTGAGLSPIVGVTGTDNLTPVYVGPFTDNDAAENAKSQVQNLKTDYKNAFATTMTVKYNPTAVPAASLTGVKDTDMKQGLDTLNSYLQEVAMWMENRATADTTVLAEHGKTLGDLANKLSTSKDARVKEFANMAVMASTNANQIEGLSNANTNDADYQTAMAGYMNLVNQYTAFQAGK